jgi:hypothetical protein
MVAMLCPKSCVEEAGVVELGHGRREQRASDAAAPY